MKKTVWVLLIGIVALAGCQQTNNLKTGRGSAHNEAARLNTELGKAYIRERKYEQALLKLRKALAQDPNYSIAHGTIAILYERLGEIDKSDRHFRQALKLAPGNARIRNNYGAMLCRAKRYKAADRQFKLAVKNPLYQHKEFALTNAGLCALRQKALKKAEAYFRSALRYNPRFYLALFNMAQLSYQQGFYLPARAFLQRYIEVARHSPPSLWLGYRIELKLGNKDRTASYALLLRSKYPGSFETKKLLELEKKGGGS
jgi:type IV pilus assembly protein PilF